MSAYRRLWHILASLAVCGGFAAAQTSQMTPPVAQPTSWLESLLTLPVFHWLSGVNFLGAVSDVPAEMGPVAPPLPPCSVSPLPPITDPDALAFESRTGSGPVVDLDGLTPLTSRALSRFTTLVASHGGSMTLTSAYRPEAYQQHLRDVWYKWMWDLRDNNDPSCADLRAEVGEEFARHQLLTTQHPVPISDHTLGIGFDAAVLLPGAAGRARRRRMSLDRLAHLAGMMRPDIPHDPVHFRLIGGRG